MNKHGFTLIEILLVIAILPTISGLTIVSFQRFQIRSDLNLASEQINQGIARARLLAQNGKDDGAWGFYASNGTVFEGLSYPTRTIASEEYYPMPSTIQISGLTEVVFSKGEGRPSATGTIVLTDLTGEQRQVNIFINAQGIATNLDDRLTICHCQGLKKTLELPESAWPAHRDHGDHLGACTQLANECG